MQLTNTTIFSELIEKLQTAGFDVGVFYQQELARVFVVPASYLVWKRKDAR